MVNLTVAQRKFTVTFTVYCVAKTTDLNLKKKYKIRHCQ